MARSGPPAAPLPGVRADLDGGVLEIVLDRAEKRNALDPKMMRGLNAALSRAAADPEVRAVLLLAKGPDFCAGLDTAALNAPGDPDFSDSGRFIRLLAAAKKPLVAGVTGRAIGVGFTLLLHCDWIVAAQDSLLMAPFVALGLTPEAGSTVLLRQRIGYARAFAILSSLTRVSGAQAADWGLVNISLPAPEVEAAARSAARRLADLPAGSLQSAKALMRDAPSILDIMDREGVVFDAHMAQLLGARSTGG